jgi:hypothetical protein
MHLILLLFALGHGLAGTPVSSVGEHRSCTDPGTRVAIKAAVQERLGSLGMPRDVEALALLSKLDDAHSDQSRKLAAVFQQKSGLPASAFKLCEVADPSFDDPMFITVLFVDPANDQPGGLVLNFGFPGAMAEFGDRMRSVQP